MRRATRTLADLASLRGRVGRPARSRCPSDGSSPDERSGSDVTPRFYPYRIARVSDRRHRGFSASSCGPQREGRAEPVSDAVRACASGRDRDDPAQQAGLGQILEREPTVVDVDHGPRPEVGVARDRARVRLGDARAGRRAGRTLRVRRGCHQTNHEEDAHGYRGRLHGDCAVPRRCLSFSIGSASPGSSAASP